MLVLLSMVLPRWDKICYYPINAARRDFFRCRAAAKVEKLMPSATPIIKGTKEQMQHKIKIVSLTLFSAIGLLLGGNVFADGGGVPQAVNFDAVSAQIELVAQKINQLSSELKSKQISVIAPAPVLASELTQEKLNYIESEVGRIAKKTERLKIEVAIFVTLREIERKTAQIAAQIASGAPISQPIAAAAQPADVSATAASGTQTREEIEAQIAKIRQQISELTQEMDVRTSASVSQSAPISGVSNGAVEDEDGDDSGDMSAITIAPAEEKARETQPKSKSFWESAGDFLKKLFTF